MCSDKLGACCVCCVALPRFVVQGNLGCLFVVLSLLRRVRLAVCLLVLIARGAFGVDAPNALTPACSAAWALSPCLSLFFLLSLYERARTNVFSDPCYLFVLFLSAFCCCLFLNMFLHFGVDLTFFLSCFFYTRFDTLVAFLFVFAAFCRCRAYFLQFVLSTFILFILYPFF